MKTRNERVMTYTAALQDGELQAAYRGILDTVGRLRAHFCGRFPEYEVGGIYQGYMDMSYFPITPACLKEIGLKIAVVYLHKENRFEAWLSAKNRGLLGKTREKFAGACFDGLAVFHDAYNLDAVLEYVLAEKPDFDNEAALTKATLDGVEKFIAAVAAAL